MPQPYRPGASLPSGSLTLEASAGTGKTFGLAAVVARTVAEAGIPIGEILVVTFTRAATAELRSRIRSRLREVETALHDTLAGRSTEPLDDDLAASVEGDPTVRRERLDRVRRALAEFDTATITTIHGFCQQVLTTLGIASPGDPEAVLVEDSAELIRSVCTDLIVRDALAHPAGGHQPKLADLQKVVAALLANPGVMLRPEPPAAVAGGGPVAPVSPVSPAVAKLAELSQLGVGEVHRRRQSSGTLAFDDLLIRVSDALDGNHGVHTRAVLRGRFRMALVDEFQDTDPVQWNIFRTLFADGDDALLIVGDPKQAIYSFRGADVHTYLRARNHTAETRTLRVNWRSDGPLLDALEVLFEQARFGDDDIGFHPVATAPGHEPGRIGLPESTLAALHIRVIGGDGAERNKDGSVSAPWAQRTIADDLAGQLHDLFRDATLVDERAPDGVRPVDPGDVAVLVRAHGQVRPVLGALRRAGIPAVVARAGNVLDSPAAQQWHLLLRAVARPTDRSRARAAALGWFLGWSAERLDGADDDAMADLHRRLTDLGADLTDRGVVGFLQSLTADGRLLAEVLARPEGDRDLTDLDHLAELLVASVGDRSVGPAGLLAAFDQLRATLDTEAEVDPDALQRRIESDERAVQIMTIHAAKGLEFPVVVCPGLWSKPPDLRKPWVYVDRAAATRVIELEFDEPKGKDAHAKAAKARWKASKSAAQAEARGDALRLGYVALTRARHHLLLYWAPVQSAEKSILAQFLFGRGVDGRRQPDAFAADRVAVPADDAVVSHLRTAFAGGADHVRVEAVPLPVRSPAPAPPPPPAPSGISSSDPLPDDAAKLDADDGLAVRQLDPLPDRSRSRWSFTRIGGSLAHGRAPIDPDDSSGGDEGAGDEPPDDTDTDTAGTHVSRSDDTTVARGEAVGAPLSSPLPLGAVRGGTTFGNLVHDVLEHLDFATVDLEAALAEAFEQRGWWWGDEEQRTVAATGVAAFLRTPLGPRFDDRPLTSWTRADRLDELRFDLPLGHSSAVTVAAIGQLVADRLEGDDPLLPWATGLAEGARARPLRGLLNGSIDLVARVRPAAGGPPRFVVVDYKTNRLGTPDRALTDADYHPARLVEAMAEAHYPLQALLYSVALHRYLRWRLPDYRPDVHLGGVAYLFVRGLRGPDTPTVAGIPHGSFDWTPPVTAVTALSDLLDGGEP